MLGKPSRRPQTRIAIAGNPGDTKTPKNRRARGYSNLGIKRRPDFENRVKDTDCTIPEVGNCEGHRIVDAAARIAKGRIRHAGLWR